MVDIICRLRVFFVMWKDYRPLKNYTCIYTHKFPIHFSFTKRIYLITISRELIFDEVLNVILVSLSSNLISNQSWMIVVALINLQSGNVSNKKKHSSASLFSQTVTCCSLASLLSSARNSSQQTVRRNVYLSEVC